MAVPIRLRCRWKIDSLVAWEVQSMKRVWAVVLAAGMFLPLIATPVACSGNSNLTTGQTFLKMFAKPECLAQYGWLAGL
jgi:hypothetical protein